MNNRNNSNNSFIIGIILAAIAVGTGSAWLAHNYLKGNLQSSPEIVSTPTPEVTTETQTTSPSPTPNNTNVQSTPTPSQTEVGQKTPVTQNISVYWVNPQATQGLELQPTKLVVANKSETKEVLETAFQQLLSGNNDRGYTTTIPTGTKLLDLKTDKTGIHINLSGDFIAGGGSESMMGRLGQVIYTATTLEPKGKVWIDVDGKPLEYLGGEGIEVSQPMTRVQFQESF
jgi:spore germination protein GerM